MAAETDTSTRPTRVLVVDDEQTVREMVGLNLRADGYEVIYAGDGNEALAVARASRPDIVVLDVMLPGRDGFEVCRMLRQESSVPILLLSARGEEVDRVIGLEIGADDYLTKPFAMRELVARVRAMLRRIRMSDEPSRETSDASDARMAAQGTAEERLEVGDITVNVSRHEATVRGTPLSLTSKEFALLQYLARHPGIVLSREAMLREVWGYDFPIGTRTVDVHISWLRQKLEEDPAKPRRILTVRGHGYRLVPADTTIEREWEPANGV
ncbi:MAG TPA: response regulator transcription factor [Thermomicrobiales bacterium]|nr:response regulator transcription factor [Thermomicrobiales bacterium]